MLQQTLCRTAAQRTYPGTQESCWECTGSCNTIAKWPKLLDHVPQVFEECNPDSPYSFQFIDPTRHQPTYGAQRSNATTVLCQVAGTATATCGVPFP